MSSLLTATPFTVDNVRPIFEKTRNLERLCDYLSIPDDKRTNAATAAEWYVNHSTWTRTWQWMIYSLDMMGETALADSIMDHAEPPAGVWCVHA